MLARSFARGELSDLLGGRLRSSALQLLGPHMLTSAIGTDLGVAVWSEDSPNSRHELPQLVIARDGQGANVLAWIVTYSPTIRPFTAYCRVVEASEFEDHLQAWRKPQLGDIDLASVGGIVGELLSTEVASERLVRGDLTRAALQSSLMFVLLRETALFNTASSRWKVLDAWTRVRSITSQPRRNLAPDAVASVAAILRSMLAGLPVDEMRYGKVSHWCRSVRLGMPLHESPVFGLHEVLTNGTREDRVLVFDQVSRVLTSSRIPPEEGSFLLGYLASSILPGSMRYATLLRPMLDQFRTALIWLGICAGLRRDSEVLQEFGGIGRRVLRDLLIPEALVDFPRSDIAVGELEVLLGGDRKVDDFMRTAATYLTVELVPGVQMSVNWQPKKGQVVSDAPIPAESVDSLGVGVRASLSRDLDGLRRQIEQMMRALSGTVLPADSQDELFEARPRKRGPKK